MKSHKEAIIGLNLICGLLIILTMLLSGEVSDGMFLHIIWCNVAFIAIKYYGDDEKQKLQTQKKTPQTSSEAIPKFKKGSMVRIRGLSCIYTIKNVEKEGQTILYEMVANADKNKPYHWTHLYPEEDLVDVFPDTDLKEGI